MGNKFDNEIDEQFMDEYCAQDEDDDLGDFIVYSDEDEESSKHRQNHQELDDEHQQELDDDELEEEVEDEVEEEVEEVEEEEEEAPVGQQEILSLREQLKEEIRRKNVAMAAGAHKPNLSSSKNQTTPPIKDGYGTFFGPSKPVLARRVIEEGCSTIMKDLNSPSKKDVSLSSKMRPGTVEKMQKRKFVSEEKRKADTLRNNRDYSCLFSDDVETQPPTKDHPESSRAPLVVLKSETQTQDAGLVNSARKSRVFTGQPASSTVHGLKKGSGSLGKNAPHAERKGAIASGRNGSNLPIMKKKSPGLLSSLKGQELQPSLHNSGSLGKNAPHAERKGAIASGRNGSNLPIMKKKSPGLPSSLKGQELQTSLHNKRLQASIPGQKLRQQPQSQRPQGNGRQPPLQGQLIGQNRSAAKNGRLKSTQQQLIPNSKFKASNGVEKRAVQIRKSNDGRKIMHNYDEFAVSDEDESDMEADFASIQREERRSAALARKEDQEQLQLIKEEERRERAMKRKRAAQKK